MEKNVRSEATVWAGLVDVLIDTDFTPDEIATIVFNDLGRRIIALGETRRETLDVPQQKFIAEQIQNNAVRMEKVKDYFNTLMKSYVEETEGRRFFDD